MRRSALTVGLAVLAVGVGCWKADPAAAACYWDSAHQTNTVNANMDGYSHIRSTVEWSYGRNCAGQPTDVRIHRIYALHTSDWAQGTWTRSLGWAYIYDRANDGLHEWFNSRNNSCSPFACDVSIEYYPGVNVSLANSPDGKINVSLACIHCTWTGTSGRYFHYFLQGYLEGFIPT